MREKEQKGGKREKKKPPLNPIRILSRGGPEEGREVVPQGGQYLVHGPETSKGRKEKRKRKKKKKGK